MVFYTDLISNVSRNYVKCFAFFFFCNVFFLFLFCVFLIVVVVPVVIDSEKENAQNKKITNFDNQRF